jgi:hypothetical protein
MKKKMDFKTEVRAMARKAQRASHVLAQLSTQKWLARTGSEHSDG